MHTYSTDDAIDPEVLKLLISKKRDKHFLKFKNTHYNQYFVDGKYIYIDLESLRAHIDEIFYIAYSFNGGRSREMWVAEDLANPSILKNWEADPYGVVEFMDDALYIRGIREEDEKTNYQRHCYWLRLLTPEQRLVYELEGNYPGKIYGEDEMGNNHFSEEG